MAAKERKIIFMLTLVLSYFFVEIFVGFLYKSLALVADACHMLSDGLCLVIALIAIQGLDILFLHYFARNIRYDVRLN